MANLTFNAARQKSKKWMHENRACLVDDVSAADLGNLLGRTIANEETRKRLEEHYQ